MACCVPVTTLPPHVGVALNSPAHSSAAASTLDKNGARFPGFGWSGEAARLGEPFERAKMNGFICPPFSTAEDLGSACKLITVCDFSRARQAQRLRILMAADGRGRILRVMAEPADPTVQGKPYIDRRRRFPSRGRHV